MKELGESRLFFYDSLWEYRSAISWSAHGSYFRNPGDNKSVVLAISGRFDSDHEPYSIYSSFLLKPILMTVQFFQTIRTHTMAEQCC